MIAAAIVIACTPDSRATADVESSGIVTVSSTIAASSDATTDAGPPTDGSCREDEDCLRDLRCFGDRCYGCASDDDCRGGWRCWDDRCSGPDEVPACLQRDAPVCGDGVIDALEECEGGTGCDDCRDGVAAEPWVTAIGLERFVLANDGTAIATREGALPLVRYAADGGLAWAHDIPHNAFDLAVDVDDMIYVVGSNKLVVAQDYAPWVASFDESGALRWSVPGTTHGVYYVIAVDATRVIVGGATEQAQSPWDRGLLAHYDKNGGLVWTIKLVELASVPAVASVGDEIAVLGGSSVIGGGVVLMRLDGDGAVRWSTDVTQPAARIDVQGMTSDGDGGTWTFGAREAGPWAVRHDAEGVEIDHLDCIGANAGSIAMLAVDSDGRLALGIHDTSVSVIPWVAIVQDGIVTAALTIDEDDAPNRMFSLAWRESGGRSTSSLVVGWSSYHSEPLDTIYRVAMLQP